MQPVPVVVPLLLVSVGLIAAGWAVVSPKARTWPALGIVAVACGLSAALLMIINVAATS